MTTVVIFTGEPGRQPDERGIFEQVFLAAIHKVGVADVMSGQLSASAPLPDSADA